MSDDEDVDVAPVGDDWEDHPFWADKQTIRDESTPAGKVAAAMQGEFTPEERAESCKDMGNKLLKQATAQQANKKMVLRQAAEKYKEGLVLLHEAASPEDMLQSHLLSNLSHVEGLLGNWRSAFESAHRATQLNPKHLKSFYRAARAAEKLSRWQTALELCAAGLQVEPGAVELVAVKERCDAAVAAEEAARARTARERARQLEPFQKVASYVMRRGFRVTKPQFGVPATGEGGPGVRPGCPWLGEDDLLHFPALFFYPEAGNYHDIVGDCCEIDVINDHLCQFFAADAEPLPFDDADAYSVNSVQLYYCTFVGTPLKESQLVEALAGNPPSKYVEKGCQKYGPEATTFQKVNHMWTFAELMSRHDHVMPGLPVLWVLVKGSEYEQRFLKSFDPRGFSL